MPARGVARHGRAFACMGLVGGDGVLVGLLGFRLAYEQAFAESGGRVARAMLRVRKGASG